MNEFEKVMKHLMQSMAKKEQERDTLVDPPLALADTAPGLDFDDRPTLDYDWTRI